MTKKKAMVISLTIGFIGLVLIGCAFLFAQTKVYTVSFDTDGGNSITEQEIKEGEKVNKPTDPTKEGYSFVKWEYQNKEYDFQKEVNSDLILKAVWNKNEVKYQVTITIDGKTSTTEVGNFNEINLAELGFTDKEGYVLKWYVNGEEYDTTTPITSDMDLEGKYEKVVYYTVKFNTDGGSKIDDQKVIKGEVLTEPVAPTKEDYVFEGWYLNNKKYDFTSEVTKNITLVAKWEEDPNVKRYEITFNSDGGTAVAKQRVVEGKTITEPKAPTKNGYAFEGWYLNDTKYDFKTKVNGDITLIAKWKVQEKYTVDFNSNGGTDVVSQTVNAGEKATKPANPTRSGFKFKEWKLNGTSYNFDSVVTSNITLIATWEKDEVPDVVSTDTYEIRATKVDNYSPDSTLRVYKNNNEITVKEIRYTDGVKLCDGSKLVVATNDIQGESEFIVVLNDNTTVRAKLK